MRFSTVSRIPPIFSLTFCLPLLAIAQFKVQVPRESIILSSPDGAEPMVVINDSVMLRGFDFSKREPIQWPDDVELGAIDTYAQIIDGTLYLIGNGCGPVLKYIPDYGFKRIDESFDHANQYRGVLFNDNGYLSLWGGYGLFTSKRILTRFDPEIGGWSQVAQPGVGDVPTMQAPLYFVNDEYLYVTNGYESRTSDASHVSDPVAPYVWRMSLADHSWERMGEQKLEDYVENIGHFTFYHQFLRKDKAVAFHSKHQQLAELDFVNNRIDIYELLNVLQTIKPIRYFQNEDKVVFMNQTKGNYYINSVSFSSYKGEFIKSVPLYHHPTSSLLWYGIIGGVLLLAVPSSLLLFRFMKSKKEQKSLITYHTISDQFVWKNEPLLNFTHHRKNVLVYLVQNQGKFVMLSDLENILDEDDKDSYTTVKKRRELVLKDLRTDLAVILGIDKEGIFITRKNQGDKRLKEIKLAIKIRLVAK